MFNLQSSTPWFQQVRSFSLVFVSRTLGTRTPASVCPPFSDELGLLCAAKLWHIGYQIWKGEHKCREERGRRKCRLLSHVEESKVLLTIASGGWCTLIHFITAEASCSCQSCKSILLVFLSEIDSVYKMHCQNAPHFPFPADHT